jgi:hypothetical protein
MVVTKNMDGMHLYTMRENAIYCVLIKYNQYTGRDNLRNSNWLRIHELLTGKFV